jgi:hypothetical protein
MAGIWGVSATMLEAKPGATFNNVSTYADFKARSFIGASVAFTASSVSGAVSLDLTAGSMFTITLDANMASLTFSGAQSAGQTVYIHFVQDATGGRTLSGVAPNLIKFAGATQH